MMSLCLNDSGFFSPEPECDSQSDKTIASESKDCLTPLPNVERKPYKFYKKSFQKPKVFTKYDRAENQLKSYQLENNRKNFSPPVYQTTFIRVWHKNYNELR